MEKDKLIERLNFTLIKKDVIFLAVIFAKMDDGVSILFKLCESDNEVLSFHSAWVLENVLTSNPELFAKSLSRIVEITPTIKHPSLKRHFCKLLNLAMEDCRNGLFPKDTCHLFDKLDMEPVVESCFEWLMDPAIRPAVKVHCMDILVHLSNRYDWIKDELPHVVELQMIDGSPGLKNKGGKIIEALKRIK
jgi:hypothetical protein